MEIERAIMQFQSCKDQGLVSTNLTDLASQRLILVYAIAN